MNHDILDLLRSGNDLARCDHEEVADEIERLRTSGRTLIRAMDDMHSRGETFTARVSIAASELRRLLSPTWPKDQP